MNYRQRLSKLNNATVYILLEKLLMLLGFWADLTSSGVGRVVLLVDKLFNITISVNFRLNNHRQYTGLNTNIADELN